MTNDAEIIVLKNRINILEHDIDSVNIRLLFVQIVYIIVMILMLI